MRYKFLVLLVLLFFVLLSLMFVVRAGQYNQVGSVNIIGLKAGGCTWPKGTDDGDSLAGYNGTAPVSIGDFDLTYLYLHADDFYYDDHFIITINNKVVFISIGKDIQTYITPPPNIYLGVDINDFEWNPPLGHNDYSVYPLCPSGSKCEKGVDFPCSQQLQERCPSGVIQETEDLNLYINLSSLRSVIGNPPYYFRVFATGDNNVAIDCNLSSFTLDYGYYTHVVECGDGIKEEQEECDDGNTNSGDGCSSLCEIEVALNYANWTNANGIKISQGYVGEPVQLIARGIPDSTSVNFSIYTTGNSLVTSMVSSITAGKANISWTPSVVGIYYFNASVVSNTSISIKSGNLDVISGECIPKNCQQWLESLDIDNAVDIWGSWNNGTCSGSIDCVCGAQEIKVEDPGLNPNNNGGICMNINIIYCSDYNITNFGNLLSAKGNCTADTRDAAIFTIETNQGIGKGLNWCGSPDGDCTRTCICDWRDVDGTEQCVGTSGRNCPNPGDNGYCDLISYNLIKDCDLPPIGFRNITYYYQWVGANPDPECKNANVLTRCISRTTLGFSSTSALVIAVIIIVVFYLIVIRKPGKRKNRKK